MSQEVPITHEDKIVWAGVFWERIRQGDSPEHAAERAKQALAFVCDVSAERQLAAVVMASRPDASRAAA